MRQRRATISVVLPFRDAGATIDAALSGLLAEHDPSREVLAIDDGSTDSGASRVRAWAARDPRLRLLEGSGSGLVAALNLGLAHAQGALIARMDADDIAHPERLSRQRAYLCAHPELAVLGCRVEAVGGGEGLQRYVAWQNTLLTPEQHAQARFIESPLCHPSIMARRAVLRDVGGYRELDGPEDYELFLRCMAHGHALAKLPEVLLAWHHREGRATFADSRYARSKFGAVKAPYLTLAIGGAKVALWGAGQTGRRLARELAAHGVHPSLVVDIDPLKLGRTVRGAPIVRAEALDPAKHVVIAAVGARGAREIIRPQLEALGFREGHDAWFAS
ncbi:MAG TPA: glycosyltransferase [Polyangiales bacterium]|nr:glycosyltransferase [Polyangiales bacterium]